MEPRIKTLPPETRCSEPFLYLTSLWNLGMWGVMLLNTGDEEGPLGIERTSLIAFKVMALLIAFSYLLQFKNIFQRARHKIKPAREEELENNSDSRLVREVKDAPYQVEKLQYIDDPDQPFNYKDYYMKVKWTLGEGTLYHHMHTLFGIFDRVQKKSDYYRFPVRPKLKNSLIYCTRNSDMASKGRCFEFLALPGYLAGFSFSQLLRLNSPYSIIFVAGYTTVSWMINVKESYLLKEAESTLNLEGYSYKYASYFSCPPTCLGQQCSRKITFYPNNDFMRSALDYFYDSEKLIKEFQQDKTLLEILDPATQIKITNFQFLIHKIEFSEWDNESDDETSADNELSGELPQTSDGGVSIVISSREPQRRDIQLSNDHIYGNSVIVIEEPSSLTTPLIDGTQTNNTEISSRRNSR